MITNRPVPPLLLDITNINWIDVELRGKQVCMRKTHKVDVRLHWTGKFSVENGRVATEWRVCDGQWSVCKFFSARFVFHAIPLALLPANLIKRFVYFGAVCAQFQLHALEPKFARLTKWVILFEFLFLNYWKFCYLIEIPIANHGFKCFI